MRFDITDLRLFLNIVEAGSITHGAARTHLALASASERLRGMEDKVGIRLLERNRRGVRPTEAGEALAHHARLILRQTSLMQSELDTYACTDKGTIRLLANTAALTEFLPDALAPWLAAHPRVNIDIKERASTEIVTAITSGVADIGVFSDTAANATADTIDNAGLECIPFAIDRLVVVVEPNHRIAQARAIGFQDILDEQLIGLPAGSALQEHIDAHARRIGRPLQLRIRVRSFEGICRMVSHGVGIGIVPETAAKRCRRTMKLRCIRLTDEWATRRLVIGYRDLKALPPYSRKLVAHLGEANAASAPAI